MTFLTVNFSARDLELLTTLASDQLFRRELCDSRLPGAQSNPAELDFGKRLVERLRVKTGTAQRNGRSQKTRSLDLNTAATEFGR
jgi:hypothetical protein